MSDINILSSQQLLASVEEALLGRQFASARPEGLFAPIDYTLSLGGKRVRPLLCMLSAQLYGDRLEEALRIAVALEIFHNFTLLHDDLMDRSPLRRGQPTVYRKWDDNTAILSGDVMSIEAYRALAEIESPELLVRALPIFNQMAVEICCGQQYDMEFEHRDDVSVEEYIEMIRLKTAVLLGASLRLGALSAGANEADALLLDEVGQALGLAFQIQDDYLDVYGDEATFGKPIGGDIVNGKKTLMLLYTRSVLSGEERTKLDRLMSLPREQATERIEGVRQLYDQAGTPGYARERIKVLTEEALGKLRSLEVEPARLEPLVALFDSLSARRS